ncbi:hypothetical protein JN11_04864 [Mucilaginibacter frigoritolerans]|uniref:Uncharacterized protein n=1 Tax=Mucilaginibacter frigoritolerans TaxID=652788 RepID=A0A562TKJ7_9SPHI|nr:hypothetical protein [Mucilaginibacter frigoritolerans]TWI94047.1 hypothetical protein JN11_04864 [Mucilaginibacter frigoritolerans]
MYIAYSALNQHNPPQNSNNQPQTELQQRYEAYQTVCDKYRHEIAAIQKYLPGWTPKFR